MSSMPTECVDQYACLAANINFNLESLRHGFWQLTIDGLSWGAIYALVAVGYTLVFGVLRLINFAHSEIFMLGMFGAYFALDIILGFTPSGNAYNKGVAADGAVPGHRDAVRDAGVRFGAAVGLEFVAYRPLRRRNAPLADLPDHRDRHVVRDPGVRALRPAEDCSRATAAATRSSRSSWCSRRRSSPSSARTVSNVTLVIIAAALVLRGAHRHRRSTGPSSAAASARSPRIRPPRR